MELTKPTKRLTADKILMLEELLLQSQFSIKINYYGDSLYAYEGCEGFYASREEALVSLLVKLYDSFSDDERLQIKEILEVWFIIKIKLSA